MSVYSHKPKTSVLTFVGLIIGFALFVFVVGVACGLNAELKLNQAIEFAGLISVGCSLLLGFIFAAIVVGES